MTDQTAWIATAIIVGSILLYFLPSLIAGFRGHRNTMAIFFLNLFGGWIFIGWIVALVWACLNERQPSREREFDDDIEIVRDERNVRW